MIHSRRWVGGAIAVLSATLLAACASADPGSGTSSTEPTEGKDAELVLPIPVPKPGLIPCGGFAGLRCPAGFQCVDDPRDDCSPCNGGADCGGICVQVKCTAPPACDPKMICTQVLTCVDGLVYPTGCGPRNCDKPIGKCDGELQ